MVPLSCHRTIISAAIQLFTLSCVVVVAPTHSERRAIIYQQRYHVFPVHRWAKGVWQNEKRASRFMFHSYREKKQRVP